MESGFEMISCSCLIVICRALNLSDQSLYSISNLIHSLRELNCHICMFTTLMLCYVLYNLVESGKKGKKGDLKKEGLER